jgi:hypothetical protein
LNRRYIFHGTARYRIAFPANKFLQETKTAHYDLGICSQVCIRFGLIIPDYLLPTPEVVKPPGYNLFWFIHPDKDSSDIGACFQLRGVAS